MRAHCKSKSDDQRAACGCRKRKQAKANTGPTPSRAATFAKRTKKSDGGNAMVNQAQKNYRKLCSWRFRRSASRK